MDNMTFEQAEQLLTPAQKDRIARCLWEDLKLPQGLNEVEKAFAFGLYTFVQYEDKGALRSYFVSEASQAEPEQPAPAPAPQRPEPAAPTPMPQPKPEPVAEPRIAMPKPETRPDACVENFDLLENKHTEPVEIRYTQAVPEPKPTPAAPQKAAPVPGGKKGGRPMYPYIKNIPHEQTQDLAALVSVQPGQIVSRTLAQNPAVSLTLFAFDEGEEISTHSSEGDAMVQVLEGEGLFAVDGVEHTVAAGQVLVMPAGKPHAVYAPRSFKMLLTVVFPRKD